MTDRDVQRLLNVFEPASSIGHENIAPDRLFTFTDSTREWPM